jgi:hypothetical protein
MQKSRSADDHLYDLSEPLQLQFKMTARVALSISVFAAVVLFLTLYFVFKSQDSGSYFNMIQAYVQAQDQLIPAMFIGGAMIILMAGLITWFILLYSSARIAGPLFRFTRNVEMQINEGPVQTVKLRQGDYLQDLSGKLSEAANGLSESYALQLEVVDELYEALDSIDPVSNDQYKACVQKLKGRVNRNAL